MNELQIFNNPEFGDIRVIEIDGDPWIVGKDVAAVLGYARPTDAARKLVDDEDRGIAKIETPSGVQEMTIINESGLYSLVLSSKLPGAKKFRRWVTSEVLPSIRKTGSYTMPDISKELQAIFMLDSRTMEHDRRITALEDSMVIDYGQQRTLRAEVNAVVVNAMGGKESSAYADKTVRGTVYSECNRDIQNWFRVNSRNNIPRKRFDEAVEYIQRWHPSANVSMLIQQTNRQTKI